jgi:hypothetical protein
LFINDVIPFFDKGKFLAIDMRVKYTCGPDIFTEGNDFSVEGTAGAFFVENDEVMAVRAVVDDTDLGEDA